ncbi:MAG TPA: chloride channel protein [Gaiellaceae bacterium]|nr:chloride channel protein [Gaiellaceae bacterium]
MSHDASRLDRRLPNDSIGGADLRSDLDSERRLADFTVDRSVLKLVALALVVGALSAGVALALIALIGFFTHLAYYGDVGWHLATPSLHRFGAWTVLIPVVGGLIVGLMARFGSERIRGHGIPEAMETILIRGSKVEPRLVFLKPISSAISIGSGGPFGAEGPIILTGGAVGSVFAQFLELTARERRTLLVAGASAGMAAVFGTPLAAVLFGVEILVFEWRPRSFVPIVAAVAVADTLRTWFASLGLLSRAPLFPLTVHPPLTALLSVEALTVGLACGILAWVLTAAVYGAEDAFKHVPIHWTWWPAIGGLVIGLGGLADPRALGVGYGTIADELAGRIALGGLALVLVVKLAIWAIGLGSGTSGGVLAPQLLIGAAAGGLVGHAFGGHPGVWALLGMGATLAGAMRAPLTAIVFSVELTHEIALMLPLVVASATAFLLSVLLLKRSIITEKIARRGFHVMREYAVDPLEAMFVREVMQPAVEPAGGVDGLVAYQDEVLRVVAGRMAAFEVDELPVVDRETGALVGAVTVFDLLAARRRQFLAERSRERPLQLPPLRLPSRR